MRISEFRCTCCNKKLQECECFKAYLDAAMKESVVMNMATFHAQGVSEWDRRFLHTAKIQAP